jgi:hypothetical protein
MRKALLSTSVCAISLVASSAAAFTCTHQPDPASGWAQVLGGGLTVVGGSTSLSTGEVSCALVHEPPPREPAFYFHCPHRACQQNIAYSGKYLVRGLQYRRGKNDGVAKVGSSRFGLQDRLRIYETNAARTSASAGHGVDVLLFGNKLKLPPQKFQWSWSAPATGAARSSYTWKTMNGTVSFKVPAGGGDMVFKIAAQNAPDGFTGTSRKGEYEGLLNMGSQAVVHDWLPWFPVTGDAYMAPALDLETSWSLDVMSPPLGIDLPIGGASVRFGLKGTAKGTLNHADSLDTFNHDSKALHIRTFTDNTLVLNPSLKAYLRARIDLGFLAYTKTWELFEPSAPTATNAGPATAPIHADDLVKVQRGIRLTSCVVNGNKAGPAQSVACTPGMITAVEVPPQLDGPAPELDAPEPTDFFPPWGDGIVDGPQKYLRLCFDSKTSGEKIIRAILEKAKTLQQKRHEDACEEIRLDLTGLAVCDKFGAPDASGEQIYDTVVDEQCVKRSERERPRDFLPSWANL